MLSVSEAQERILERISPLDPLELSVADAHGCVLAEVVTAPEDLPPFATAALDGFALRSEDTSGADSSPVSLTIVGEAAVSRPFAAKLAHGEAVRVSTGAALPEGADAVVRPDDVAVVGSSMAIGRALQVRQNVRPAGEDVAEGDAVMQEGQRIRGMDVGVVATLGRARVMVRPRPRVVVFSTGDELRDPGAPLGAGLVRDANSSTVAAMVREAGAEPSRAGIVADDPQVIREKFQSFLAQADVFISTGGLGTGTDDHLRETVLKLGPVEHWALSMEPEGSIAFGTIEGKTFIGLPGNPVAAMITFELFCRPALLKMAGRSTVRRNEVEAMAEDGSDHAPARQSFVRVRAWRDETGWRARLSGRQSPSLVSSVADANALAVVGADRRRVEPGEPVTLMLLEPLEGW